MTITRVISGGQTGADRGALYGALDAIVEGCPITVGGWAPSCWIAEDGSIPEDLRRHMRECDVSGYPIRTVRNIADSDATLVLYTDKYGAGTALTIKEAMRAKKLLALVNLTTKTTWVSRAGGSFAVYDDPSRVHFSTTVAGLLELFGLAKAGVINVAGPRESRSPGLQAAAEVFVMDLILAQYPHVHDARSQG